MLWTGASLPRVPRLARPVHRRPLDGRGGIRRGHDGTRQPAAATATHGGDRSSRRGRGGGPRDVGALAPERSGARTAERETRRAEASKLLALGQIQIERFPTAALAHALRSLELADTEEARLFALRALQMAPPVILTPSGRRTAGRASRRPSAPTERGSPSAATERWRSSTGTVAPRWSSATALRAEFRRFYPPFARAGDVLVTDRAGDVRAYSFPEGRELWTGQPELGSSSLFVRGNRLFTATGVASDADETDWVLREWDETTGASRPIGRAAGEGDVDPTGRFYAYPHGRDVEARDLPRWALPRHLGTHEADVQDLTVSPDGRSLAAIDAAGEIRVWSTTGGSTRPRRVLRAAGAESLRFDPTGRRLAAAGSQEGRPLVRVWDLTAPPGTRPLSLRDDQGSRAWSSIPAAAGSSPRT